MKKNPENKYTVYTVVMTNFFSGHYVETENLWERFESLRNLDGFVKMEINNSYRTKADAMKAASEILGLTY